MCIMHRMDLQASYCNTVIIINTNSSIEKLRLHATVSVHVFACTFTVQSNLPQCEKSNCRHRVRDVFLPASPPFQT